MVKADGSLPRPHHVAWQSPSLNYFSMMPKRSLVCLPTYLNSSTCMFPAVSTFHGFAAPSIPILKTELTNEVQGFLQHHNADTSLKETHVGGALQRLFYGLEAPSIPSLKTEQTNEVQGFLQHHNADTSLKETHVGGALQRLFYGLEAPSIPSLKTEQTNEVQGFLQHHNADTSLKETHVGGSLQNANPSSLQKRLLIFDRSDNKTRLFYGPVLPLVQSPTIAATKFAQSYVANGEGQASNVGQKNLPNYSLLEESDKDHAVIEESENHEDTEEINALLYSNDDSDNDDDDDSDEVTSTDRSPLATKMTHVIQEQFEDMKEDVASSDWPNKRLKLIDGDYNRSSPPVQRSNLARPNGTCDCVSDAESKNSSRWLYSVDKAKVDDSVVCDIKLKKDKIRESLRVLENLIPGAKGKEPLFVIDGTIQYLKFLMSQSGALGDKYH